MDALIDSGEVKQIIIITEGKPGSGISPVEAARKAYNEGIVVSAVGIVNTEGGSEKDMEAVKNIAEAGGGLWYYSDMKGLKCTIREITHGTALKTIEQIVSRQLKTIIGGEISALEPQSRKRIMDFIEKYGGSINLKCVVVIDTGKSIRGSLSYVKRSIAGLLESLKKRKGRSSIAVIVSSCEPAGMHNIICDFTDDTKLLNQKLEIIRFKEGGQAGASILAACELMNQYYEVYNAE